MSWLTSIMQQHEELESPSSFWYWSAIAAISAVVKDQVWMDRVGIFKTYPNIYVMLHAESGLKKGPPVSMAKQLVTLVNNTRVISGRSSIQGILKKLGTSQSVPGGKILKATAFICSSELSSSIIDDSAATRILTDLYDRQYNSGEWASLLKMEEFSLKDPTVTMLTATNEAMSESFFTKSAIQGGYFARTFIIYEKEGLIDNSLIYPLEFTPDYSKSADYLKEVAKLSGPFSPIAQLERTKDYRFARNKGGREIWFNEVGAIYDDWYLDFKQNIRTTDYKDETGTLNRFGDSVLKVAMLLSLASRPKLEITEEAMNEAITECNKLLGNAQRTTLGKQGISTSALLKTRIIMELLNRTPHQISRAMLMKRLWSHYSTPTEFDEIMQSFDANGMIKTDSIGNQIIYTMPDAQATQLRNFMERKKK